ncbi:MAG: Asp-tRNA(Asn)/Glu-tRNA(Gln) amidotransferase subunit GatB [Microscillaceae bacterium]|nr:Asp-tRNA(Asn)/Glu-tRNA(Gln) amidotransferase subunit GatB [Microscillaceae bacterium]MDW8461330.1 Asp-tRNA(Asn)/Glu-tRNA(Gln) amidotransferase subunit GatB [Cytophagales bacterium]
MQPTTALETIIGLEVHVQLATKSKLFASDSTAFGSEPNSQTSPITLGHPGTLPKINRIAIEYAIRMGLACKAQIASFITFDRKNYFYPDLPKGYQITQDKTPICKGGFVCIGYAQNQPKIIPLHHIHLEEDAGKSLHRAENDEYSYIDYNRAGVPLIEIVTQPVLRSAEEAQAFLMEIRRMVQYLGICDGNMEEGSLRCDVNISLRPEGSTQLGTRVEIKNLNSFRNVAKAITFEQQRQMALWQAGKATEIVQETRQFNTQTYETTALRTKENLNDYRYFIEPDLPPVIISQSWLAEIQKQLPLLPHQWFERLTQHYRLSNYDAEILLENQNFVLYFEQVCQHTTCYKAVANWLNNTLKSYFNENTLPIEITSFPRADLLAELIEMVAQQQITQTIAQQKIFPLLMQNPHTSPKKIAQQYNLLQENNTVQLQAIISEVLTKFEAKVQAYKKGKKGLFDFFTGEVMKRSQGKASPLLIKDLLEKMLKSLK